jgi:hypothetical protein
VVPVVAGLVVIWTVLFSRFGVPSFVATLAGLLGFLGAQLWLLGAAPPPPRRLRMFRASRQRANRASKRCSTSNEECHPDNSPTLTPESPDDVLEKAKVQ